MINSKNNMVWAFLLVLFLFPGYSNGQQEPVADYPKVGDTITDHEFTDLDNFDGESFKISDFRGKWLIIDFWSRFCGGCIHSFPKMNSLHKQFKDRVQILMVSLGYKGKNDQDTEELYYRMKAKHKLEFAVAFGASSRSKFAVGYLPMILVVNPEGIIVAKTSSVNAEQLNQWLNGETPIYERAFSVQERPEYDHKIPLLTSGVPANGGNDTSFLFRSLLVPYTYEMGPRRREVLYDKSTIESGKIEVIQMSLRDLYLCAYFSVAYWSAGHTDYHGKYSMNLALEIADSTDFIADERTLQGYYSYSLIVPPSRSSEEFLKQVMQSDLRNYFNYDVSVEERMMPAFHLVVVDKKKARKLKARPGDMQPVRSAGDRYLRYDAVNTKMAEVVSGLQYYLPDNKQRTLLIDKTNINYNVSFSFEADMLDMNSLNQGLAEYGLKIVKGLEKLKTLVIRDIK